MNAGQSQYGYHAVGWLERAPTAYRMVGCESEWQAYLGEIRERHGRKYKLVGLLKGL
jgi:uncharacterized Zn finger protein